MITDQKGMSVNSDNEKGPGMAVDDNGLKADEARLNNERWGDNVLSPAMTTPIWRLYIEKYNDPMIRVLLVAAALSLCLALAKGDYLEVVGIFIAIFLATTIGFLFERDAARRFKLLSDMDDNQEVKVVRDGRVTTIARRGVTVGDVVVLDTGDEVPADGVLISATGMLVDESALTGETATHKGMGGAEGGAHDEEWQTTYGPQQMMRSSLVIEGHGRMRVTAIGDHTEIGKLAKQATEMTGVKTPLDRQLNRLAKLISRVGGAVAVSAFAVFLIHDIVNNPLWHGDDWMGMAEVVLNYLMMAVTLIVMAVPEGLPMAVTLALALNMRRMVMADILVRKLHACETMGAVTVICTDKTGTLTENRMRVAEVMMMVNGGATVNTDRLMEAIAINSTAELDGERTVGNPTEGAMLLWMREQGADYKGLRDAAVIVERTPFSTERKWMETVVDSAGVRHRYVKGAPDVLIDRFALVVDDRVLSGLDDFQRRALRTMAVMADGELLAVFGISDPLRAEVPEAMGMCDNARIKVKIVTGDNRLTAMEIARRIGGGRAIEEGEAISGPDFENLSDGEAMGMVDGLRVMFRARPADKQRLVRLLQERGEVVAVTGDGTNDAPALHYAHVGLSLGAGTAVAKNASDMTLMDNSFAGVVRAVVWGRSLYKNIQRFLLFQLTVNVAALFLVLGGALAGTQLPLTITQMLWVNLIMDAFAAMALASLPPEEEVLNEPPRRQEDPIINRGMWMRIVGGGLLMGGALLLVLLFMERRGGVGVRELTVFFTMFVMMQWWNLFNAKTFASSRGVFSGLREDRGLLLVMAMILVGQWVIVSFGGRMFRTVPLDGMTWAFIVVVTSPILLLGIKKKC